MSSIPDNSGDAVDSVQADDSDKGSVEGFNKVEGERLELDNRYC